MSRPYAPLQKLLFSALMGVSALAATVATSVAAATAAATTQPDRKVITSTASKPVLVSGVVRGEAAAIYRVQLHAGQTLQLTLTGKGELPYFNLTPAGAKEAMFIGSTSGSQMQRVVPMDGWYDIDVYLMRAAARRGSSRAFTLSVATSGEALKPLSGGSDALVAGTPFHATAMVSCTAPYDTTVSTCKAGVVRRDRQGTATVAVTLPQGVRHVLFVRNQVVASDSAQDVKTSRQGEATLVRVGSDESFLIPDPLLTGG